MRTPLVSIVMPVRNAAAFIDEAIASIRCQTLRDHEFIIVDDGCSDASIAIAARHAAEDARIRILSLPASGLAVALNHGLAASRTEYVARFDADGVAMPDRLERQVEILRVNPSVAVLGGACETIDAAGRVTRQMAVLTSPAEIRATLPRANCMAHPTTMVRREAVLAASGYRPAFVGCEDYDLWLRLAERHDLMNLADPLVRCRFHAGQVSHQDIGERALAVLAAQHASCCRRAGRGDPTEGVRRFDRATLRRIGVGEAEIAAAL